MKGRFGTIDIRALLAELRRRYGTEGGHTAPGGGLCGAPSPCPGSPCPPSPAAA